MKRSSFTSKIRGSAVSWILMLIIVVVGAGMYMIYQDHMRKEHDAMMAEQARLEAEEKARLAKLEAERKKKEEEERLRLEEEERQRLLAEAERKRLEEEERLRRLAEEEARRRANQQKDDVIEDTPDEIVEVPDLYKNKVLLAGMKADNSANKKLWAEILASVCTKNEWAAFKPYVKEALGSEVKRALSINEFKMQTYYESPLLQQAMAIDSVIGKLEPGVLDEINDADVPLNDSFMHYLLTNTDNALLNIQRSLSGNESPEDITRILSTWKGLWDNSSAEFRTKYQSLALACALVRPDKRESYSVRTGEPMTMEEVYKAFCESAENKKLKTDITKMPATDLIYVVNISLPRSEMEWAQKNVKLTQPRWGEAFPMVRYLMDRAKNNVDPYTDYTFADLKKVGGVCRDQGYFASNTARCNGIPACYMTGDGHLGPHAWFIYMDSSNSWASAGGYGYTSGKTTNPQTGERVHESLFNMRSDKRASGKKLEETQDMVNVYRTLISVGQAVPARKLLALARLNTPSHPLPWLTTIEDMEREDANTTLAQWEELSSTLRKRFRNRPDFLSIAQNIDDEYVRPNKDSKDVAKGLAKDLRKVDDDRADLVMEALDRQVEHYVSNKQPGEADKVFRKALRDYAKKTDTVKPVMERYYNFAKEHDGYLTKAVDAMDRIYKSSIETDATFYFNVKQEVGIAKLIAGYHKEIGNDRKAEKLEKTADRRMAAAMKDE